MIEGYFGLPGSGKTYFAVKEAKKRLDEGQTVVANFLLKGAKYFKGWREFSHYQNCTFIIDEAGIWLNARKWSEIPESVLYRLMQSRKRKFDLIYTAQDPEMVEVTLRRLSNFYWHMRQFKKLRFHTATLWEPQNYRKERKKSIRREYFTIKPEIAELYDTEAIIDDPFLDKE